MLVIAWLVMKRLTAPLQEFTRHVAGLPGKDSEQKRVQIVSKDEIGTLARAFNDMVTALDEQQEALRESMNNFRTLAETACDGMLVIVGTGTYAYANQRIAELTCYSIQELYQLGIRDLAHPDDFAYIMDRFSKIISREGFLRQYETRMIRKDSLEVPVEISSALTLWRGEPAVLIIVRDISERRRVDKALRDSYTLLQKTFASLNEAVFIVETGTRIIRDCNITVEKMFGYTREELIGVTTYCLHLSEQNSSWFGNAMLQSYAEKGYFETTFQMKRKDGTVFDSEHCVTPIRDDEGLITSHVCVVRDVSERKRAEEALRAAFIRAENEKARTEAIIAAIGEGIIIQDRDFKITYQNEIHKALIGDHPGEYCYHAYQGREQVCEDCPVEMAFSDGCIHTVEKTVLTNGSTVNIEITASPLHDAAGEIVACIELVRDITERRRAEEEIKYLNVNLQRRATDLAVANRDLEAFGFSLSHDLKGPLTAIYSAAQTLEDICAEQMDETGRFCLDTICKASERMEELLDAMLLLARISRSELQQEEIDLSELTTEILERLQEQEPARVVEYVIAPGVKALADTRLMKSALENLLGNAWKYTRKRGVTQIEFGVKACQGEETYFVRDNGIGFEMKNAEIIFLPFHRLYQAKEFEGTGIGLTTVQRIIQRHGGRLWGEGEPDQGATFYFTLADS